MGVLPEHHRAGIGLAMLEAAESWLAERDVAYLQVKTLSPRHPDTGYAATRAFYFGCGFRPLEEMPELWGKEQPALQMIKSISPLPPFARPDPRGGEGAATSTSGVPRAVSQTVQAILVEDAGRVCDVDDAPSMLMSPG